MKNDNILAYSHPTNTVLIDDNADFLVNLSLHLDSQLSFQLFQQPSTALAAIASSASNRSQGSSIFAPHRSLEESAPDRQVIDLELGELWKQVTDPARFDLTTVAVVDYDMPEMNGLEFCNRLAGSDIRKILLTGKADETIAIEAFNRGLIDRFIVKQRTDALSMLNAQILELGMLYLEEIQRPLSSSISVGPYQFLQDPAFCRYFQVCRKPLGIIEHYLLTTPKGLLMLDIHGTCHLLAVMSEDDLIGQYEIAELQGAPESLLQALRAKNVLPCFPAGHYVPECQDWQSHLYPAENIQGRQTYRCAVMPCPPHIAPGNIVSYARHLAMRDADYDGGIR